MQATHDNYADNPSSSVSDLRKGKQHEDMKGAQFIVQSNLKILSRSVAALSKISEDMYIEVDENGLHFKVFHRSKYCVFRFAPEFFNSCDLSMINKKTANICRLSMRSAQRIFKGVALGEKNFVGCEFRINPKADKLIVNMQMNYDINRTIQAKLRETVSTYQKPAYDRAKCRNVSVLFASILLPILVQLKNDIEVTMNVDESGITIRNFHSEDGHSYFNSSETKGNGKKVKTETTISADKLTRHRIQIPVEFSFSLREMLSIILFADQLGSEVCLYYDLPGRPLIVSMDTHPNFDVELAVATLGNNDQVDLDGVVTNVRMNHENTTRYSQISESTDKTPRAIETPLILESDSDKRPTSRAENKKKNEAQKSQARASAIEREIVPVVEQSWRDNEIVDLEKEEEEQHLFPDLVVVEQVQNQSRQENMIMDSTARIDDFRPETSRVHSQVRQEFFEEELFQAPQPKKARVIENRNKMLRSILMGTKRKILLRMDQQFHGMRLVQDTQN